MVTIRKAEKKDNAVLASLIRAVFDEHNAPHEGTVYSDPATDNLYRLFSVKGSLLLVAEDEGEILGCCGIYPTPGLEKSCAELVKFYLKTDARGKGTGRELMEKVMASAVAMGYSELYLESLPQFSRAVSMYEKLGFRTLNHPMGNSGHRTCHIWMHKVLREE
ncbi:MAG TPA: GNAT family N-acetyltransferase [Bacteroidales bacterium]|nr:GNAT family N-acetyltransferase [Bacteroidales bacterium]